LSGTNFSNELFNRFFEELIDALVFELYFLEETKEAGCEVIKHLGNLPELKEDWSDEKKLEVIDKVYRELSDPLHPVSLAMAKMQEIEEVKIIEGRG
jgi:adenine-specific DNA-methyltransferase